jgi:Stealth protein CR2, conserved region 2/Stealth protein CR1, conserved region 1
MKINLFTLENSSVDPIDAVVTWVNGSSPSHQRKRHRYMAQAKEPLNENAINPHRWACNDEILYCLQSIENHAPWVRKIWIVIDDETPNLHRLSPKLRAKIGFVFHHEIFDGFANVLPTFNSLAIESMLWRIHGLSERFLYFNDDVFLAAPLTPSDVFQGSSPVLRGKWANYGQALQNQNLRQDPAKFNHYMQLNAARIMGFDETRLFQSAHVVHPMRRSVMSRLFHQHKDAFIDNIGHRFRDLNQFLPQGLHNHACIAAHDAVHEETKDHLHIKSGQGLDRCPTETVRLLGKAATSAFKFLCVNDLPQLEVVVPDAREWLSLAIGGFCE